MESSASGRAASHAFARVVSQPHTGIADLADSGVLFSARVNAVDRAGAARLAIIGERARGQLTVRLENADLVQRGDRLRLRAERQPTGDIRLAILEIEPAAAATRSSPGVSAPSAQANAQTNAVLFSRIAEAAALLGIRLEPRLAARLARTLANGFPADRTAAAATAIVAAADKGLALETEGVRNLAAAIDPDARRRPTPEGTMGDYAEVPSFDLDLAAAETVAAELRERFRAFQERRSAASLVNKARGRNGKRWIIFPFRIHRKSVDIEASLRLLLNGPRQAAVERLDLEAVGPTRSWRFSANFPFQSGAVLNVSSRPPLGADEAAFMRALNAALAGTGLRAIVRPEGGASASPWEWLGAGSGLDILA